MAHCSFNYITNAALLGVGFNQLTFNIPSAPSAFRRPRLSQGLHYDPSLLTTASLNPGLFPARQRRSASPNFYIDPNAGRPSRILQWSFGVQREVVRDLVVEANYVGNRGAWETGLIGGRIGHQSSRRSEHAEPGGFAKYGIDPTTAAGQATLAATLGSALGKASGVPLPVSHLPYRPRPFCRRCGPSRRSTAT